MDQKRLEALLEEATVDCYGEEEEFTGVLYTLADNLNFPLQASELWSSLGLALRCSSRRHPCESDGKNVA